MFLKQCNLTALLSFFVFSSVFAQVSPRTLLQKYNIPVSTGVARVLSLTEKESAGVSFRGVAPLRLDSTRTFLFTGSDSMPESRNIYKYPHPDTTATFSYVYINGIWAPVQRLWQITRPGLYTELTEAWDEDIQGYTPAELIQLWSSNGRSAPDSVKSVVWDGSEWSTQFNIFHEFDANGKINRIKFFFGGFNFVTEFTYNAAGEVAESTENLELSPGLLIPLGRTTYLYMNGLLVETVSYSQDDPAAPEMPSSRNLYRYDPEGREILVAELQWNQKDSLWAPIKLTEKIHTIDDQLATEIVTQYPDTSRTRTDYAYLPTSEIHRIDVSIFDRVDSLWYLDTRTYYYYNGSVRTTTPAVANMKVSPNPVTNVLQIEAPFNSLILVRDITGRTLQSVRLTEGKFLDVSALTPGAYTVSAWYEGKWHVAKIVK